MIRWVASGLVAWIGWIHLHLWLDGYRDISTIGPSFLVAGIAGFLVACGLLLWPSRLLGYAGIGLVLGELGALVVSINIGLLGFKEALSASFVGESIILEIVATVSLCVWIAADAVTGWRRPGQKISLVGD